MNEIDRRDFLVATALAAGGGLALALHWRVPEEATLGADSRVNPRPWLPPAEGGIEINPWIVIGEDDYVLVRVNQSEVGQGVLTSNAMMIAEELECGWDKVHSMFADPHRHIVENNRYHHLYTAASSSVRLGRVLYQQAGASARERLKQAAADVWGVAREEIEAGNSVLSHKSSGRTLRYGEVAAKAASIRLPSEPAIKPPEQFRLIGSRVARFDVPLKARAQAIYGIDVRLPNMLYAASRQCPVYGGTLKRFTFEAIRDMPGVVAAVPMEGIGAASGIAVVADSWWHAKTALDKLPVVWDSGPNASQGSSDLFAAYRATLETRGPTPVDTGDVERALSRAVRIVEAEYQVPHQAHAQLEPPNCTAQVTESRAEVWMGSQNPDAAFLLTAKLTGLPPEQVFVHNCFEGGGFGMGGNHGELQQAVTIAKALKGRPVKLLWTREEDLAHVNGYHPMGVAKFTAGLDRDGMPVALWVRHAGNDALEHTIVQEMVTGTLQADSVIEYGPTRARVAHQLLRGFHLFPYGVPNYRVEINTMKTFVPCSTWRSTGSYASVFYLESFIEELARAAGRDPISYRRALIERASPASFEDNSKDDWLMALDVLREKSGAGRAMPKGSGIGFAMDDRKSVNPRGIALVALAITVSVSQAGAVSVERMDIVHDQGHAIVNPEAAERQLRGMMAWGLGAALSQEITFANGGVEQRNYDDYAPLRMDAYPKEVAIHYIKTKRWISGIGEELVPLVAPALCNAIAMATGIRVRSLPLRKHDLRWA